jgi:hypothetical protein
MAHVRVDGIVRRVEGCDILGDKRNVRRDERSERPTECRLLLQAGTDENPVSRPRPEGLSSWLRGKGGNPIGHTIQAAQQKCVCYHWIDVGYCRTVHTYLVVVVFGNIHDRDVPSCQRLASGFETIVQLMGDAKLAGACLCVFS